MPRGESSEFPDNYYRDVSGEEPEMGNPLEVPQTLDDPRWAHYQSGVNGEFDVPPPSGSLASDEIDLETTYGTDIWATDQGPLAEDLVELRDVTRSDATYGIFGPLVGYDEARRLSLEAHDHDEQQRGHDLMWEAAYADPKRFLKAIQEQAETD